MKPAIVVYFNGTFVNVEGGSQARLSDMLQFLGAHFDDVTLYSYVNHVDCPWTDNAIERFKVSFPHIKLCLDQYTGPLRWLTRAKDIILSVFPQHASAILTYRLPGASPEYIRIQSQAPDATWIINYANGMTQLNGLPRARKIIVDTHDLIFLFNSKLRKASPTSARSLMKLRNEIASLNSASALISISPLERAFFKLFTRISNNFYIPSYLQKKIIESDLKDSEFIFDLCFVGSDVLFNIEGFIDFIESNASWVCKYRICVAGMICRKEQIVFLSKTHKNIHLLGYVDDLSSIYRTAKAVISPTEGTGLKMKVVDALFHGKPIFASDHTRDGLPDGYESCVFPIDRTNIESVLNTPENRRKAETAAFHYARTLYYSDISSLLDYLKSN
jgi:hypothetical protein